MLWFLRNPHIKSNAAYLDASDTDTNAFVLLLNFIRLANVGRTHMTCPICIKSLMFLCHLLNTVVANARTAEGNPRSGQGPFELKKNPGVLS